MDSVPRIFVESVCLCLDHSSRQASESIPFLWGKVSTVLLYKIHTLFVHHDNNEEKLYAAAMSVFSCNVVSLDSVSLKFITNFCISSSDPFDRKPPWKEITVVDLQKLLHLMRPTAERSHHMRYIYKSCCSLEAIRPTGITRNLFSMRLPVDCVTLSFDSKEVQAAAEEFLENAEPLYSVSIWDTHSALKQSTVDALMSDKKVALVLWPEGATESSKVTDFFDFDKHYSSVKRLKRRRVIAIREGAKLKLRVQYTCEGDIQCKWKAPSRK
uniref:FBD domain-containing protein n=1 Tax=Steinernema glaseri TaxID=37863 RepID=A0A1I7YGA3_9BILA